MCVPRSVSWSFFQISPHYILIGRTVRHAGSNSSIIFRVLTSDVVRLPLSLSLSLSLSLLWSHLVEAQFVYVHNLLCVLLYSYPGLVE